MGRSVPAAAVAPAPVKPLDGNGPGSNGYWRRERYRVPGTFTFTAKKDGTVKIQAIGAASGGDGSRPGGSGAYGEKVIAVVKDQTLTVVLGQGGQGSALGSTTGGSSTSISGVAVGGTPLVLVGALDSGLGGTATGPWSKSFSGAQGAGANFGSPSSASPFGAGKVSSGYGGAGWGGGSAGNGGASSHRACPSNQDMGAAGLLSVPTPYAAASPVTQPEFWDLEDVDGAGGSAARVFGNNTSLFFSMPAGPGAGGAGDLQSVGAGASPLGGGTGFSSSVAPPKSGNGAGGGRNASIGGGNGGDAYVLIFWDEVTL